jgi:TPP-dependent pyruvate/acetoin dehydrogenase alpha subunit
MNNLEANTVDYELSQRGLSRQKAEQMLTTMMLIRAFEEKAEELYMLGRVHGTMHLSIGQEAAAVGLSSALTRDDYLLTTAATGTAWRGAAAST